MEIGPHRKTDRNQEQRLHPAAVDLRQEPQDDEEERDREELRPNHLRPAVGDEQGERHEEVARDRGCLEPSRHAPEHGDDDRKHRQLQQTESERAEEAIGRGGQYLREPFVVDPRAIGGERIGIGRVQRFGRENVEAEAKMSPQVRVGERRRDEQRDEAPQRQTTERQRRCLKKPSAGNRHARCRVGDAQARHEFVGRGP